MSEKISAEDMRTMADTVEASERDDMGLPKAQQTLSDVSMSLRSVAESCSGDFRVAMHRQCVEYDEARNVIDAHLAQHAAMVAKLRELRHRLRDPDDVDPVNAWLVIESYISEARKLTHDPESQSYLYEQVDKLATAIGDK